jgi:hypothetical protein
MTNKIFSLLILYFLFLVNCSNNENYNENNHPNQLKSNYKHLNLTILIDLSDRISILKNPEQPEKDIEIITYVIENFKKFLAIKGVVNSEDRIKVIFYPVTQYDIYKSIADSLNIDFGLLEFTERKIVFELLNSKFKNNLRELYVIASNAKSYPGSDLFNYFKHRITDDCINSDTNFINILTILTDGYIYYDKSKYNYKNRFSYLTPLSGHIDIFRNMNKWEEYFHNNDYGLIKIENDLSKLNILLCEFNPIYDSPKDFDIMKLYWSKWLEEQNVRKENYKIIKTEIASINKNLINSFFENIFKKSYVNQ